MIQHKFMWASLVHLCQNMFCEEGNMRGEEIECFAATPYIRFDKSTWDKHLQELIAAGTNTIILDLADALRYESHPELSVEGSWSHA